MTQPGYDDAGGTSDNVAIPLKFGGQGGMAGGGQLIADSALILVHIGGGLQDQVGVDHALERTIERAGPQMRANYPWKLSFRRGTYTPPKSPGAMSLKRE